MELTVTIKTPELRHDAMNKTALTARSLQAAGKLSHEAASAVRLTEDSENHYEMCRSMATALFEVKAELMRYIDETKSTTDNLIPAAVEAAAEIIPEFSTAEHYSAGDKVRHDGKYWEFTISHTGAWSSLTVKEYTPGDQVVFVLNLPDNFNGAAAEALSLGIHDYVVNKTLYIWYKGTLPEIAESYIMLAQAAMNDINSMKNKRRGALVRKMYPF